MIALKLNTDVLRKDYSWLKIDFKAGDVVYYYSGNTYGCVESDGLPCSINGELPFFEIPRVFLDVFEPNNVVSGMAVSFSDFDFGEEHIKVYMKQVEEYFKRREENYLSNK